jgi:cytochrome b561
MVKRAIATVELLFVFPAALFMTSLFLRQMQPTQYQPARAAQRIVEWFSARPHLGLAVLLIALPFAALVMGSAMVLRHWQTGGEFRSAALETVNLLRAHVAMLIVTGTTLMAGGILAIVAVHMITD